MADRDAPPGSVTGRTPPLGARGRSSSFPNLNPFGGGAGTDGAVDEGEPADGFERVATPREEARTNAVWYLPPLGLRHLSEVRGRNLVPPRGAEHSRGAGFRFTLALHPPNDGDDGADANDDARVVYASELAVDTLNPDWEPLDDVELERCARGISGETASSSSSSGVDPRGPRRRSSRLTLTVWHVESPTRGGTARVTLSTPIALDDLVRVPTDGSNGTNAHALASIFGPFAADSLMNKDDDVAFPPNTPMVRLPPRTRYSRGVGGYVGYDGVGSSSGSTTWYVPGGCAWRALRDSAVKEDGKDAADAVDAVDSLLARERGDGTSEGAVGFKEPVAIGSPIARGSRVKRTDGFELRRSIESIVKVAADLGEVVARRDELRDAIGASEVAAAPSTGATSMPSLVALKGRLSDATRDVAALRRRVNELRGATRTRAEAKALRLSALEAGTKRLGVARARLAENDAMVSGAHGRGRLHQQQRALVARRWQLVADLASVFPIAPARTGHQSGGGGESSRGGGKQKRTWSIAGVPLDLGQSGKPQGANSLSNAIGNGLLPGSTVSQSEQERRASALGYVTQAVLQLAAVLDVPLRYPVAPGASRSYICDLQPTWAGGSSRTERVPGSPSHADHRDYNRYTERAVMWRRAEFPLFVDGASESTRFTYAVFLLNKDLEQLLNAHGLLAVGPRQTLPNLRRLLHGRTHACESAYGLNPAAGESTEATGEFDGGNDERATDGGDDGGANESKGGYESTVAVTN